MQVLVVTVVHTPLDARIHHRQIRSMVAEGWDVTYAAPFSATGTKFEDLVDGVTTIDLPRAEGRHRLRALFAAGRLIRSCSDQDVVLLHDPELMIATIACRRRVPIVLDVHEDLAGSLNDRAWIPRWIRPLVLFGVRAMERWAERNVGLILAERRYAARFRHSHPLVRNLPWHSGQPTDQVSRDRVIYVGRLSRARGLGEMLELGRRLRALKGPVVELVGLPDQDMQEPLQRALERGDVRWHGFVPSEQALRLVDGALAGLSLLHDLPNYRASLPTKVVEYLSRGVPVVTTPLPEAVALVAETNAGVVVPFGDVEATVIAVMDLHRDSDRRDRMAALGRSAVGDRWTWDAEAATFLDALRTASR